MNRIFLALENLVNSMKARKNGEQLSIDELRSYVKDILKTWKFVFY